MKRYMLVLECRPLYNPQAGFVWEPRFFPWKWLAWCFGSFSMLVNRNVTHFTIYEGKRIH